MYVAPYTRPVRTVQGGGAEESSNRNGEPSLPIYPIGV